MQPAASSTIDNTSSTPIPKGARSAVALLLSINLFNYLDRYVLAAVEPRISEDLLKGDPRALAKMGTLATAFIISYMVAAPIFGWLADRMSRWLLVGIGVIVWSLASGASGLATSFTMLLVTRLFVGIGEAGYGPAAPTIISDLYPIQRRGYVLSFFYMAIPVGSALGYMWGGKIEAWLGWRWAFYTVVPPGLLLGVWALTRKDPRTRAASASPVPALSPPLVGGAGGGVSVPEAEPSLDSEPPLPQPLPQGEGSKTPVIDYENPTIINHPAGMRKYLSLIRNRSYVLDCAGMTAMTFAIGGIAFWMPHYIAEYRKAGSLEHVNFVFGLLTVVAGISATLLGGLTGDKLRTRFPGAYFLVSGVAILISCPFVILMLYSPFPMAWLWAFVAMFFLFFNTGPSNTILANVTHPSIRSTAFALNIFFIHAIGDAISPPVLGALVGKAERWNLAFFVVAAVMAIAGALWLWGARYLEADTLAAEAPAPRQNG